MWPGPKLHATFLLLGGDAKPKNESQTMTKAARKTLAAKMMYRADTLVMLGQYAEAREVAKAARKILNG